MKLPFAVFLCIFLFQTNHPPVVKINAPSSGSANSTIRYSVNVTDKEDGDTKYDEIASSEILLRVSSVSDTSKYDKLILHSMMASNCMNCHAFSSKLIGPSFADISKKYFRENNVSDIVRRIREGSKGVWGDIIMPTHPELSLEETEHMVKWIIRFNERKDIQYYLGKEGSLLLNKPVALTASYLDHNKALGEDRMVIEVK